MAGHDEHCEQFAALFVQPTKHIAHVSALLLRTDATRVIARITRNSADQFPEP